MTEKIYKTFNEWKEEVNSGDLCGPCHEPSSESEDDMSDCCNADLESNLLPCVWKARQPEIDALLLLLEKSEEALRFYSEVSNWSFHNADFINGYGRPVIAEEDCSLVGEWCVYGGKRAREYFNEK